MIAAFWFGAGLFLIIAASAAFSVLSPMNAGNVVGAMLTRWHYIALAAPVLLLALEWRKLRTGVVMIVFVAILFAAMEALLDIRLHELRATMDRRWFGMLHGISSLLLLGQVIAAAAAVSAIERDEVAPPPAPQDSGDRVPVDVEVVDRIPE